MIGVGGKCLSPGVPQQGTNVEDEPFMFEMAPSAQQMSSDNL